MADADEDLIQTSTPSNPTYEDDLEDETQDFRFLAQLTGSTAQGQTTVPKRGTKDFEPNPTRAQASTLDASRLAMHTALSAVRIHAAKTHVVGQYYSQENQWRWDGGDFQAENRGFGRCVVVYKFKSTHLKVMGQADRRNWVWFLPEEALFLLERGSLDIRWPDVDDGNQNENENDGESSDGQGLSVSETSTDVHESATRVYLEEEISTEPTKAANEDVEPSPDAANDEPKLGELPMSLQGAYASFIGKDGLTLERYIVYAALKRAGYIVQRAPTWHDDETEQANGHTTSPPSTSTTAVSPPPTITSAPSSLSSSSATRLIRRLCAWLFQPQRGESCRTFGPLVAPGLYRNYADVFRSLALVPYHDSALTPTMIPHTQLQPQPQPQPRRHPSAQSPYRISYHVWKPSTSGTYRKTAPPPPDYRICVIDARNPLTDTMPTLAQISHLLDAQPLDLSSKETTQRLEARIKHGTRNVMLAVVDAGIISYLRVSDAGFGREKLFEEKVARGSKGGRGGRGGGGAGRGGRGGGRGQRGRK